MATAGAFRVVAGWLGVIVAMATDAATLAYAAEDADEQQSRRHEH